MHKKCRLKLQPRPIQAVEVGWRNRSLSRRRLCGRWGQYWHKRGHRTLNCLCRARRTLRHQVQSDWEAIEAALHAHRGRPVIFFLISIHLLSTAEYNHRVERTTRFYIWRNIDSNKRHASPGPYSGNTFIVIKAAPISFSKSHILLNKLHATLFGHYILMSRSRE